MNNYVPEKERQKSVRSMREAERSVCEREREVVRQPPKNPNSDTFGPFSCVHVRKCAPKNISKHVPNEIRTIFIDHITKNALMNSGCYSYSTERHTLFCVGCVGLHHSFSPSPSRHSHTKHRYNMLYTHTHTIPDCQAFASFCMRKLRCAE